MRKSKHLSRFVRILAAIACAALAVLAACGGAADPKPATGCALGQTLACSCPNGKASTAACTTLGSFGACTCDPTTTPPRTVDAGDAGDADADAGDADAGDASDADSSVLATDCSGSGNVLILNGESKEFVHPGFVKITDAKYSSVNTSLMRDYYDIGLTPTNPSQGLFWTLTFGSDHLGAVPLAVMSYPNAQRASFATDGHPGLDVSGDGRGCDADFGSFVIYEITFNGTGLAHLLATFEQHCESMTAPALYGCIKYDAADAGP